MSNYDFGFVVVHVPHSSTYIPKEYMKDFLISEELLYKEMRRMTDSFCDELYDPTRFDNRVVASVSRLVCDVERFRDDDNEPNARFGHGLMYTKTSFGRRMRNNDDKLRNRILSDIYDPHHEKLTNAVDNALKNYGFCLVIDGHSFNSKKIVKFDNLFSFPDFDIGTDSYHTPDFLAKAVSHEVKDLGYSVRFNSPYSGAITPLKHYMQNKNVLSFMIEVNRKLYMDEKTMEKGEKFNEIRGVCHRLMNVAAESVLKHFRSSNG